MNSLILLASLLACTTAHTVEDDDGGATDVDTDADTDGGTDGGVDSGSGTDGGTHTEGVSARLHPELESLIYVEWTQEGPATAWVEYSFDGEDRVTPTYDVDDGDQSLLLLGVPYAQSVAWEVHLDDGLGDTVLGSGTISTPDLPDDFPEPELLTSDAAHYEPTGTYLLGSINQDRGGWAGGTYWKWIMDREGRIVWLHETPDENWSIFLRVSVGGDHILWDEATYWNEFDEGAGSKVHRWYIDGTEIREIATRGLHHAFTELPDGTLAWGQADGGSENLVTMGPDDSSPSILWRCRDFHSEVGSRSSCQSNTVYYSTDRDSFLFSFYTTDTLVEIDASSGETMWWAGGVRDGFTFDPPSSQFAWQHGMMWTDEGTLLMSTKDTAFGWPSETYAREYQVDFDAGVLKNTWTYGEGEGILADTAGEAHRLPNGNTLHNYGAAAHIKEVTTDGDIVWEVTWNSERLIGRTTFIEDLYDLMPPTE
ncbi:MAG: hypothetical protein H6742_14060 [Alphaproteobacteria bacterium]|nr:hypothetical protein [Alphaproteobacteria bacterium]